MVYKVHLTAGGVLEVDNPLDLPDSTEVLKIEEPKILARIHAPNDCIGDLLTLITENEVYAAIRRQLTKPEWFLLAIYLSMKSLSILMID